MKKGSLLLFVVILCSMHLISAAEIKLSQDSFNSGQTLQAEITGPFITFKEENVLIFKDDIPRPMPVVSDFFKYEGIYYFYAILPNTPGNYSLVLRDARYMDFGLESSKDIIKKFRVKATNAPVLQVNPGFVVTSEDFQIKVKALNQNMEITAKLEGGTQRSKSLIAGLEKTIKFSAPQGQGVHNLEIEGYSVPVIVTDAVKPPVKTDSELAFSPSRIIGVTKAGESYLFKVFLENLGLENITDITLTSDIGALITPNKLNLGGEEEEFLDIKVIIAEDRVEDISGKVTAKYGNETATLSVFLAITQNVSAVDISDTSYTGSESCSDQKGNECDFLKEYCDGDRVKSLGGGSSCCIGECKLLKEEEKGSNSWIMGIIIIVVVLGIIIFFYWKMKKMKPKSTEDILKQKSKSFGQKMNPDAKVVEVSGNLKRH